ncbi:MAG: PIN domain-containing protein [Thermogutta sp.]
MRLLDTDIMVDIQRGYQPALDWLESLDEAPGLPGFVVMELMEGCRDKQEMTRLRKQLESFQVYWPTDSDANRALLTFSQARLSHNLGVLDALIAECAIGLQASLCTFNMKHFKAITRLQTEQPYVKNAPSAAPVQPSAEGEDP